MKLITRDTDYAIRALCYLARSKHKVSVAELVSVTKIPRPFLRKILQVLNKRKILESFKGNDGGFKLAKPVKDIFLIDLVKIFQKDFSVDQCLFKKKICLNKNSCLLRRQIADINIYAEKKLKSVNIAKLIG